MAKKTITAIIPKIGISQGTRQVSFETAGFVGQTCQAATKFLEAMGRVTADNATQEMFAVEQGVERIRREGE